MIYHHDINPVLISIGKIKIFYYSIVYILGLSFLQKYLNKKYFYDLKLTETFSIYIAIGVLLGGRLGYILIYDLGYYWNNKLKIFQVWEGGMSFHGGLIGFILGSYFFAKKYDKDVFKILDLCAVIAPLFLGLGRIANFINGELYGRQTKCNWGVIFPASEDNFPRHPSQIYEFLLEGLLTFIILYNFVKFNPKKGITSGLFLVLYGISRIVAEFFRQPDAQIGYIFKFFTLGQILCFFMILIGTIIIYKQNRVNVASRA